MKTFCISGAFGTISSLILINIKNCLILESRASRFHHRGAGCGQQVPSEYTHIHYVILHTYVKCSRWASEES